MHLYVKYPTSNAKSLTSDTAIEYAVTCAMPFPI